MTGILEHIWGVSPAQDRVWAQVCGIAPSKAGKRLLVPLQAYIDDSYNEGGVFVLGGHVASASAWVQFTKEWESLLQPFGTLIERKKRQKTSHTYHFKMSEMAQSAERMDRVPIFFRVIEDHVLASISCKIDIAELNRAISRIYVHNTAIDWGLLGNKYLICFRILLEMFHSYRTVVSDVIPLEEKVGFIFDDQTEKKAILDGWDDYIKQRPDESREFYGATPQFESDMDYLPLQAADLWAWWVRKCYAEGSWDDLANFRFGNWKLKRHPYHHIVINYDEDQLVHSLIKIARSHLPAGTIIYDAQFSAG